MTPSTMAGPCLRYGSLKARTSCRTTSTVWSSSSWRLKDSPADPVDHRCPADLHTSQSSVGDSTLMKHGGVDDGIQLATVEKAGPLRFTASKRGLGMSAGFGRGRASTHSAGRRSLSLNFGHDLRWFRTPSRKRR